MSAGRRPRALSIRRWLYLALLAAFFVPVIAGVIVQVAVSNSRAESELSETLRENIDRWDDPAWRESVHDRFRGETAEFALYRNGEELHRTALDLPETQLNLQWMVGHEVIIDGGDEYVAYVYFEEPQYPVGVLFGFMVLVLTVGGLGWFLARMVGRPLSAAGDAARKFSRGDLDVALPSSRVREVADVNEAFGQMRSDLRKSLESQSNMEQERRLLISAVAHDLRTPLFSLRGYLEGLEQGVADTPEKRAEYLTLAREKAGALERMIADLSDFTRLEYLDQAPNQEPVNLTELLRRLVDGLQPQAEAKAVDLCVEFDAEPHIVYADSHLLNRAIENLLDNALRHTPNGGAISVRCQRVDDSVRFSVEDTGPGISPKDLPHIFAPLYRGDSSRNRRSGGSGLGLTIARRIILAHDGELRAENADSGGAEFIGLLPAYQTQNPE